MLNKYFFCDIFLNFVICNTLLLGVQSECSSFQDANLFQKVATFGLANPNANYVSEFVISNCDNSKCCLGAANYLFNKSVILIHYKHVGSSCHVYYAKSTNSTEAVEPTLLELVSEFDVILLNERHTEIVNSVKSYGHFTYPSSFLVDLPFLSSNFTLLQQRVDDFLLFNKTWTEYADGFGHPTGNYWVGLELMHLLTWFNPKRIRFEMKKFGDGTIFVAEYSSFKVGPSSDNYRLYISGYDSGVSTVGDAITVSGADLMNNQQFSTFDVDHDTHANSCSVKFMGYSGNWFKACTNANFNGIYSKIRQQGVYEYTFWYPLDGAYALEKFKILIYN